MINGEDCDFSFIETIGHGERKRSNGCDPDILEFATEGVRISTELLEYIFDVQEKIDTRSPARTVAPDSAFDQVGFGQRIDDEWDHVADPCNRAFTSSQLAPAAGSSR